jgi:uncharacterized protein (TIGR03437 family)
VVSGNGQMTCPQCAQHQFTSFYPMVVKVTDASGNPIAGKTINWQLTTFPGGSPPQFDATTFTDSTGIAFSRLYQSTTSGSLGNPFVQFVINATVDGLSTSFTETQALTQASNSLQIVIAKLVAPDYGTVLGGPAGSTGTNPIKIHIDGNGNPVPNVSVRILNPDLAAEPSANCNTAPGADPGSVLTDQYGDALCYPVFGPVAGGPAAVTALVGGLDPANFDYAITPERVLTSPVAFWQTPSILINVTQVTPGQVNVVSGNNQNIDPGKTSAPLVVQVKDTTGNVTIANTNVVWTVSPAGAATLSAAQSTTDTHGQTAITATLFANATGQIAVKAALAGNPSVSTTFIVSTNIQIASISKVSGDQQTTQSGQAFPLPLVVQVNGTNGQTVSNQLVSFIVNGNATLSANSMLTDGVGQAKVTVTAGSGPGAVTVTAFVGNMSQVFSLTVIPPGPALTSNSFYNAGGGARLSALSPCGLVTVIASGLAPNVQGLVLNSNAFGPWATTLATDTVTVNNIAAPIYSVSNVNGVQQLTFQVPCETAPAASVPILINVGGGTGTINFPVQAATPGIYETLMSDGSRRAVAIRPDGAFVNLINPARPGDIIRVFVTGMGPAAPALVTGALPYAGADSLVLGQVIVGVNNAGARVVNSRVSPNLIGVYEIDFQVPTDAPSGNDVVLSVAVNAPGDSQTRFSNGSKLPVKQ